MTNSKQVKDPFISVVIPVYNGAKYLEQSVSSVLKSTYKNFEIILIDDGSLDTSKALCRKLEKKYRNIVFYGFAKNKGLGRVLNFALKKAKGTFICRINQDDQMYPTRLEKQVAYLTAHPDTVVVGSWIVVEDEGGIRKVNQFLENDKDIRKVWLSLTPCHDASVMYRKECALAAGGYEQMFWPADDLQMWYKLGKLGSLANIQEPLVKVRFHRSAVSMTHHRQHMIDTYKAHRWAHANGEKAGFVTQLYWIGQLIAGIVLPARVNWFVYWFIKDIIFSLSVPEKAQNSYSKDTLVHLSYAVFPSFSR